MTGSSGGKSRNRLTGALCLICQPLLLNALSIPAMAYIIRMLGPLEYGQWIVATSLVAFTAVLSSLGLRNLFVRRVAQEPEQAAEALAEQLGLRVLLAISGGFLALILCMLLHYPILVLECVALAAVASGISALASALGDVLQGLQRFQSFTSVNLIAGLVLTAVSLVAVRVGAGPVGLSLAYLIGPVTSLILLFSLVNRTLFRVSVRWDFVRFRVLLREVKTLGAQYVFAAVQDRIEQLLVPKLVGIAAFGYFSAGSMPASRLLVVPDGLATAYYPKIAQHTHEDNDGLGQPSAQLLLLSLVICVPLAVMLLFVATPISQILFPKHAEICRDIIRVTIWSVPLYGIANPLTFSLQAAGKHAEAARMSIWAAAFGCAASLLAIKMFGISGACWSWIIRPAMSIIFVLPYYVHVYPGVLPGVPIGRICCCGLLMAAFLWAATSIGLPTVTVATLGGMLALTVYGFALIALRVIKASFLRRLIQR